MECDARIRIFDGHARTSLVLAIVREAILRGWRGQIWESQDDSTISECEFKDSITGLVA